ncbi:MAG: ABC transporter ATP-binding protein [Chloroflexota bacterium]
MVRREFAIANEYNYDRRSPIRWLYSHIRRYAWLMVLFLLTGVGMASMQSLSAVLVGRAFDTVVEQQGARALTIAALFVVGSYIAFGLFDIVNSLAIRVLAQRVERNARDELYLNLLGKSQTFHGQQRIGDLLARATNDVQQLNQFISPSVGMTIEAFFSLVIPLVTIVTIDVNLLFVPILFIIGMTITLRHFNSELRPVADMLRTRFGTMNARLAEAITGIEVVKGFAQEPAEEDRFREEAGGYRDAFVREGEVTARYIPLLIYGLSIGLAFGHALYLYSEELISIGQVITYLALFETLRFPVRILLRTSSIMQQSFASARRILDMMLLETELDQNSEGVAQEIAGDIRFEKVDFRYGLTGQTERANRQGETAALALQNISFRAQPGQTVAIVGQTGAGTSTLTKLLNRTFDTSNGRILVDNIDVRDWSLDSLRGQIATIEQDIFLFSRSIAENIAFGARETVSQSEIEAAAREAQAHDFIMSFPEGYETVIGERGVMLSGGQRQRLAIARAFLSNPRILILDDSTSAIDSNTEDQIQRAMRRILEGRTTLLITHRLSQIRQADLILLMKNGRLLAQGTHEDLLSNSPIYRQIFVRDEPQLEIGD